MESVSIRFVLCLLWLSETADTTEGTRRRGMGSLLFPEVDHGDLASEMSVVGGDEPPNLFPLEEGEDPGHGFRRLGGGTPIDINDFFSIPTSRQLPLFHLNNNNNNNFGSGENENTIPMIHIPRIPIDEGDSGGRLANIPTISTKLSIDTTTTAVSQKKLAQVEATKQTTPPTVVNVTASETASTKEEPSAKSSTDKSFSTPKSTTASSSSRQSSSERNETSHVTSQAGTNVSAVTPASNTSSGLALTKKQITIIATVIPVAIVLILVGILIWIIIVRKKRRRNVRVGVEMQSPPQPAVNAPPEVDAEAAGSSSSISKVSNNSNGSVLHAIRENGHGAGNGNRREAWHGNGGGIDVT